MNNFYSFKIYNKYYELPENWNDLAINNVFLSKEYFEILDRSSPANMECFFIGIFDKNQLIGIAFSQLLNLNKLESFGDRDKCIKTVVRNFTLKRFSSHVLFIGNNMLTGQNAFFIKENSNIEETIKTLKLAVSQLKYDLKKKEIIVHITTYKDFYPTDINILNNPELNKMFSFSSQPNMVFEIQENWKNEQDYIDALSKKYRDQYKRARKKADGVIKRKLTLEDIIANEETIYELYYHVAKNAPFNTFFLAKNHFRTFKQILHEKFLFYGYFLNDKLIGFNTLIKNGKTMDTYFLGYDDTIQREKMLYLNMLYDMIGYSIKKGFHEIIFARTALEIKSSVGAKSIKMIGFMEHQNPIINKFISHVFSYLEPEVEWQERNPYK